MRFGVFVPQGWRLDLAGIPAAEQWATMRGLVPASALDGYMRLMSSGPLVTPEQIIERLDEVRALGMEYAICYFADAAYDRGSVDLFASRVIGELAC